MTAVIIQPRLLDVPPAAFDTVDVAIANDLLVRWGHRLGPLRRPFTRCAYALLIDGEPVSLAISASTVSTTVQVEPDVVGPRGRVLRCGRRLHRTAVVELARLCSAPGHSWATRVTLRVWREVFARRWPDWPVLAAVSYSQNVHHRGDVYRFDGWQRVRVDAGNPPGRTATWARYGPDHPARGPKSIWVWRYPSEPADVEDPR